MMNKIKLLDIVALLYDIPSKGLSKGQVGTVVELLDDTHFEVEFADKFGQCYACVALEETSLLKLIHEPSYA